VEGSGLVVEICTWECPECTCVSVARCF